MFVNIEKNGKILTIPSGAFNASYEKSGWNIKESGKKPAAVPSKTEVRDAWDEAELEVNEGSIEEMSVEDLKAKAESLGIDTKNLNTVGALRKAIKKATAN